MSHFSDSLAVFEVLQVSGFISCLALDAPHECLLILVSDAADARGRCPSTWTVQVSTWSSPVRLWLVVFSLFRFTRSNIWLCRDFWCQYWPTSSVEGCAVQMVSRTCGSKFGSQKVVSSKVGLWSLMQRKQTSRTGTDTRSSWFPKRCRFWLRQQNLSRFVCLCVCTFVTSVCPFWLKPFSLERYIAHACAELFSFLFPGKTICNGSQGMGFSCSTCGLVRGPRPPTEKKTKNKKQQPSLGVPSQRDGAKAQG